MPWPTAASQRTVACCLTPLSAGCQRSPARNQQILNARTRSDNRNPPTTATNLRDSASRRPFPSEPAWRWPPAFAITERAVAAGPVVMVGVAVMPAGTELSPVPPHPSKHSPHLCLSLLSYGRDAGLSSLATDMLGSTRFGLAIYPRSAMSLRTSCAAKHENTAILCQLSSQKNLNQV
jgi:hypothetical protein